MEKILGRLFWKTVALFFVGIIFSLLLLVLIVHLFPVFFVDVKVSGKLQEEGRWILPYVMKFVSFWGNPIPAVVTVVLTSLVFLFYSYKKEAIFTLLVPLIDLVNMGIKSLVDRPRPTDSLVEIFQGWSDSSFPSSHVVHYTVFFGFLLVAMFKAGKFPLWLRLSVMLVSLGMISSISVARVYLGTHWFTDVIGGYLVGFILLSTLVYFYIRTGWE